MKLDISLYIPVYNGESTIERVLKSALELDPGPNEIIVINDGSTDNTLKILDKYKSEIKRFQITEVMNITKHKVISMLINVNVCCVKIFFC